MCHMQRASLAFEKFHIELFLSSATKTCRSVSAMVSECSEREKVGWRNAANNTGYYFVSDVPDVEILFIPSPSSRVNPNSFPWFRHWISFSIINHRKTDICSSDGDRRSISTVHFPRANDQILVKLKNVCSSTQFVSLTFDGWTDRRMRAFYAITMHYIDRTGQLKAHLLAFNPWTGMNHHSIQDLETIYEDKTEERKRSMRMRSSFGWRVHRRMKAKTTR